jgi:hypothetical protein
MNWGLRDKKESSKLSYPLLDIPETGCDEYGAESGAELLGTLKYKTFLEKRSLRRNRPSK